MRQTNEPFLLSPAGMDYLWGGRRLKEDFGKDIDMEPLAETWECSVHPDGPSTAASGPFTGRLLSDVLDEHPDMLGTEHRDGLPVLVKFIDAAEDLSIQVHPDDVYAGKHGNGQRGKTEMWYVLDAAEDTYIILGLSEDTDRDVIRRSAEDGTIERYLRKIRIHPGDAFLIPPGTIHAIGSGALIAEIQENSNITYRLYDYDRTGRDGRKRELHLDDALKVAELGSSQPLMRPASAGSGNGGSCREKLFGCGSFSVERLVSRKNGEGTLIETDGRSFRVLLCISGNGMISYADSSLSFSKGSCIFIPAGTGEISLTGDAEILNIEG